MKNVHKVKTSRFPVSLAGSVFSVTSGLIVPCIILAVPAFVGWALPYFLFKNIANKRAAEITPLVEQKYDEIYTICEKSSGLIPTNENA